jgi:hypothetical protein
MVIDMALVIDDRDEPLLRERRPRRCDIAEPPVIAAINDIAAALVELLGPIFWAALISLYINAVFWVD